MRMIRSTSVGEPQTLIIHTPAKLNLYLNILGKRADGFHDLETMMVSVRLFDTIRFESSTAANIELRCRSRIASTITLPTDRRNLIIKAAEILRTETGSNFGATLFLEKRIPSEAGMGGGSSDAAATLVGLNLLWKLNLSPEKLHQLAAQLGSDVNFFLDSAPASLCTGRGEKTEPICLSQPMHFVIVKPPSGLSTKAVFEIWAEEKSSFTMPLSSVQNVLQSGRPTEIQKILQNSLEQPARCLNVDVDRLLRVLAKQDVLGFAMTGSGSACFAMCRSHLHARTIANRLKALRLGEVFVVAAGV